MSPAINRISHRLLRNKTPISSSTTESTAKQLLTKENTGITCLLRICWRLGYKSFCCFWLWLKYHLKLPSLVFNPVSLIAFRLRRASQFLITLWWELTRAWRWTWKALSLNYSLIIKNLPSFCRWFRTPAFFREFTESQAPLREVEFCCKFVICCQLCFGWKRTGE